MTHFLLVFIDGIGMGPTGSANPFSELKLDGFSALTGGNGLVQESPAVETAGHVFRPIDALLGLPGLPQSGTGQASLFTGVNCVETAGRHFGPFPHSTSLPIIRAKNIFSRIKAIPMTAAFANAYPPIFFERAKKRNRWSVTTRACLDAGIRIRDLEDLARGNAVAADISGAGLKKHLGLDVDAITEEKAAENLLLLASESTLTVFEYFHTDKAGHAQSFEEAARCLHSLDRMLDYLLNEAASRQITVLVTSDHGNLEDLSVKTHTMNPVPLIAFGPSTTAFSRVTSLIDVVPAIMNSLLSRRV